MATTIHAGDCLNGCEICAERYHAGLAYGEICLECGGMA